MAQEQQNNFSPAQMLELMAKFAAELKKPTPEEQAKIDADKANKQRILEASIAEAQRDEQKKQHDQLMCSHMKPHPYVGKTRIVAPLHGDGLHHPKCLFCHKEFKPFAPGPDTIQIGMSLDDYNGVNPQIIEHWGNKYEESQKAKAS